MLESGPEVCRYCVIKENIHLKQYKQIWRLGGYEMINWRESKQNVCLFSFISNYYYYYYIHLSPADNCQNINNIMSQINS